MLLGYQVQRNVLAYHVTHTHVIHKHGEQIYHGDLEDNLCDPQPTYERLLISILRKTTLNFSYPSGKSWSLQQHGSLEQRIMGSHKTLNRMRECTM